MKPTSVCLLVVIALPACGGSGIDRLIDSGDPAMDDLLARSSTIGAANFNLQESEGYTPFAAVAHDSGTVTYSGTAQYKVSEIESGEITNATFSALGSFVATVDFANPTSVVASATDFYEFVDPEANYLDARSAGPIQGRIDYDLAVVDNAGFAGLSGTASGFLVTTGNETIVIPARPVSGNFVGVDLDGIDLRSQVNQITESTNLYTVAERQ